MLKKTLAQPLEKAAAGQKLTDQDRRDLRTISEWILRGCPERKEDDSWANDETLADMPLPQVDDPDTVPWPNYRKDFAEKLRSVRGVA